MERGDDAISIRNKFIRFYEIVITECRRIEGVKGKTAYLKKIIHDCDKIIELAELFDEADINYKCVKTSIPEIDDNFYWLLDESESVPLLKNNASIVKEQTQTYLSFELDNLFKKNPNLKIDGIKRIKMHLEFDSERVLEKKDEGILFSSNKDYEECNERIKIKSSMTDIVRIFESLKKAEIISSKTSVKQIAGQFYTELQDKDIFEKRYNSTKSRLKKEESSSNSEALVKFIKILCEDGFKNKERELEDIIEHMEELQKNMISRI